MNSQKPQIQLDEKEKDVDMTLTGFDNYLHLPNDLIQIALNHIESLSKLYFV